MKLQITDRAAEELHSLNEEKSMDTLYISHETEGTGCVVNGVSDLIFTDHTLLPEEASYIDCSEDKFQAAIDKRVDWIYEESLILEFNEVSHMFQLKSPNQMLNPRMKLRMQEKV